MKETVLRSVKAISCWKKRKRRAFSFLPCETMILPSRCRSGLALVRAAARFSRRFTYRVDLGLFVPFTIASSSRGDREEDLTFTVGVFLFVFETLMRGSGSRTRRNGEVSSPRTPRRWEWIILFRSAAAFEYEALRKFFSHEYTRRRRR